MAKSVENPVGAVALESRFAEEAGYSEDSDAKPISRKNKNTRKLRHGESTVQRVDKVAIINANYLDLLQGLPLN